MIDEAIGQLTPLVGTTAALATVGADRATWYRHHRQSPAPVRPERVATPQPRALTPVERKEIKATLESDEFVDDAPATVYAKLLDQGTYLGSVSTMYRVLHEHDEVRERRRQATHPAHKKPELIATGANSVWSWDITKLHGPEKWTYYLPLRHFGHLQPLRRGLDAGPGRTSRALQEADQRDAPQAGCHQGSTHDSLRPWVTHDRQRSGPPPGRSGGDQVAQPTPCE
jgi:hypothetical protein